MNTAEQVSCLLANVRDWLVGSLDKKAMGLQVAAGIAGATLRFFPENLEDGQYQTALTRLEEAFPEQRAAIHAASLSCKLDQARSELDREVLSLIAAGDLDAAVQKINQIDLT